MLDLYSRKDQKVPEKTRTSTEYQNTRKYKLFQETIIKYQKLKKSGKNYQKHGTGTTIFNAANLIYTLRQKSIIAQKSKLFRT